MKIKILLPLLAVVFIIASAFAYVKSEQNFTPEYWQYIEPTSPTPGDEVDAENYVPYEGEGHPSLFCEGTQKVCVILAEEDPNNPGFPAIQGEPVEDLIEQALEEEESLPTHGVYLRN